MQRFFGEVREAASKGGHRAVLLEMSLTGPSLDIASIFALISQESPDARRLKIAYVEASGNRISAEFAETVALNRGVNVRLFRDVGAAAAWLSAG